MMIRNNFRVIWEIMVPKAPFFLSPFCFFFFWGGEGTWRFHPISFKGHLVNNIRVQAMKRPFGRGCIGTYYITTYMLTGMILQGGRHGSRGCRGGLGFLATER